MTYILYTLMFVRWGIKNHKNTYMWFLPQPCLGPQAGPTSVVRVLHIGQSTYKLYNIKQFGSVLLVFFNILNH